MIWEARGLYMKSLETHWKRKGHFNRLLKNKEFLYCERKKYDRGKNIALVRVSIALKRHHDLKQLL